MELLEKNGMARTEYNGWNVWNGLNGTVGMVMEWNLDAFFKNACQFRSFLRNGTFYFCKNHCMRNEEMNKIISFILALLIALDKSFLMINVLQLEAG
ncbi:hypothetical protein BpHYR1_018441, partial [Brachionus plicatilis]